MLDALHVVMEEHCREQRGGKIALRTNKDRQTAAPFKTYHHSPVLTQHDVLEHLGKPLRLERNRNVGFVRAFFN